MRHPFERIVSAFRFIIQITHFLWISKIAFEKILKHQWPNLLIEGISLKLVPETIGCTPPMRRPFCNYGKNLQTNRKPITTKDLRPLQDQLFNSSLTIFWESRLNWIILHCSLSLLQSFSKVQPFPGERLQWPLEAILDPLPDLLKPVWHHWKVWNYQRRCGGYKRWEATIGIGSPTHAKSAWISTNVFSAWE